VRDRVTSSAIIVFVVILPILIGGPIFAALLLILGLAAFCEYLALARQIADGDALRGGYFSLLSIVLFAVSAYMSIGVTALYAVVLLTLAIPMFPLLRSIPNSASLYFATLTFAGSLGFGLAIFAAIALRGSHGSANATWLDGLAQSVAIGSPPASRGLAWVLLVVLVTWTNDSAAYLIGRVIGRHPLAPNVSPRKTTEGSIAGLMGSSLVGALGYSTFGLGDWWIGVVLGGAIGVAGQIGDLAESYLKRSAGVKDSGNVIPGHGGLYDRIDALLFAFPTGYVIATALQRLSS
jgi:phosphatidate cytidylyltransferase